VRNDQKSTSKRTSVYFKELYACIHRNLEDAEKVAIITEEI
jgi:hypothetical protein